MAVVFPTIGRWYRKTNDQMFEVVAVDQADGTIEVQHFDGTIEEIDFETWPSLLIERAAPPEDWSGALDVAREDEIDDVDGQLPHDWSDPLEVLERDHNYDVELVPD